MDDIRNEDEVGSGETANMGEEVSWLVPVTFLAVIDEKWSDVSSEPSVFELSVVSLFCDSSGGMACDRERERKCATFTTWETVDDGLRICHEILFGTFFSCVEFAANWTTY